MLRAQRRQDSTRRAAEIAEGCKDGKLGQGRGRRPGRLDSMRRWKRMAMRTGGLLALGAATTVAVAWGVAIRGTNVSFAPARHGWRYMKLDEREVVFFTPPFPREIGFVTQHVFRRNTDEVRNGPPPGATPSDRDPARDALLNTTPLSGPPKGRHVPRPSAVVRVDYGFGFPFIAMGCVLEVPNMTRAWIPPTWQGVIWLHSPAGTKWGPFESNNRGSTPEIAVPVGVMPVGFAANTCVFAMAWWALLRGVQCVRRQSRDARGLCARCTYDLRGLDAGATCPECGHTA